MDVQVTFDYPTATKVAEYFARSGMHEAAEKMWRGLCVCMPYAWDARAALGDFLLRTKGPQYPIGSPERTRFLLDVIGQTFPSETLSRAYFENLDELLYDRPQRQQPGLIVLGVGTGRCGSTSVAAAVSGMNGACATHENPPIIFWEPHEAQVEFHLTRLQRLSEKLEIVFDAAHWWLNTLEQVFARFPWAHAVGLQRDTQECVQSFLRVKGSGPGSLNHWAPPNNGIWAVNMWDASYPSFPIPPQHKDQPDAAKATMIEQYARLYNRSMEAIAQRHKSRVTLLATEQLNQPGVAAQLSTIFGQPFVMPRHPLNYRSTKDSDLEILRY